MDRQLDASAVSEYSQLLANQIIASFFDTHDSISGADILKLTKAEQLNLLVLKRLFDTWQKEVGRLKSPYFDYDNAEVQAAFRDFANLLSRNIRIDERDFQPLLEKSIQDTITLSLCPYKYFKNRYLSGVEGKIQLAYLKESRKYIKLNIFLIDLLIEKLEAFNLESLSVEDAVNHFNDIYQEHLQEVEEGTYIMEKLASVYPVTIESLTIHKGETSGDPPPEVAAEAPPDIPEPAPASETPDETPVAEAPDEPDPEEEAFQETTEATTARTLNEEFSGNNQLNLNDLLKKEAPSETVATRHSKQPIESIKSSMGINQKFMFINLLFNGEENEFEQAINDIESSDDFEQATSRLFENYGTRFSWDHEKSEVKELVELVERRFN